MPLPALSRVSSLSTHTSLTFSSRFPRDPASQPARPLGARARPLGLPLRRRGKGRSAPRGGQINKKEAAQVPASTSATPAQAPPCSFVTSRAAPANGGPAGTTADWLRRAAQGRGGVGNGCVGDKRRRRIFAFPPPPALEPTWGEAPRFAPPCLTPLPAGKKWECCP